MKDRKITINGTSQQVTITREQALTWNFIAADSDGELWFYEKQPKPDSISRVGFACEPLSDCDQHGEFIEIQSDEWIQTATQINTVFDPDALADTVEAVIRAKYSQWVADGVMQNLDLLVNDVRSLIKAGN